MLEALKLMAIVLPSGIVGIILLHCLVHFIFMNLLKSSKKKREKWEEIFASFEEEAKS